MRLNDLARIARPDQALRIHDIYEGTAITTRPGCIPQQIATAIVIYAAVDRGQLLVIVDSKPDGTSPVLVADLAAVLLEDAQAYEIHDGASVIRLRSKEVLSDYPGRIVNTIIPHNDAVEIWLR